jgi:predicted RNA binding protein YcfA (HicA-like mRNA interferase family)
VKVRDVIDKLLQDGWVLARQESSHRDFRKEGNPMIVTVNGHNRDEVKPGLLADIRRKSGLLLR